MNTLGFSDVNLENATLSDASGLPMTGPTLQGAKVYPVPIPATILLLLSGLAGIAGFKKRLTPNDSRQESNKGD
jgi:hypothetical protein